MSSVTDKDIYDHILAAARSIFVPGQVVELRVIYKTGQIASGYFDDLALLSQTATITDSQNDVMGIYWTLNPVHPDCLHRAKNRMRGKVLKKETTTADKEIIERRLILVDFDGANRPVGISSNKEELDAAGRKAHEVSEFLASKGWESPVVGMSGNGYHLLYKTQMPNDKKSTELVKKFLETLATLFDDEKIHIDKTVFNASRISKVYGTIAKKGDNTLERPHRRSRLLKTAGDHLDIDRPD